MNSMVRQLGLVMGALFMMGTFGAQIAGAQYWSAYGTIVNGTNCSPLQGVNVSSPFNNYAFNISNSTGGYNLRLGIGQWNITAKKAGYAPITFNTPYEYGTNWQYNFFLLSPGQVAGSCTNNLHAANSTVPTTVTAVTTGATTIPATTAPYNTTAAQSSGAPSAPSTTTLVAAGLVIIIIIAVVAYFAMKGKGKSAKKG